MAMTNAAPGGVQRQIGVNTRYTRLDYRPIDSLHLYSAPITALFPFRPSQSF